jgi:hypothetical protein
MHVFLNDQLKPYHSAVTLDSARSCWHSLMFWRRQEEWMPFAGGFSFANFPVDVLTLFVLVIWFWCNICFRRPVSAR